MRCFFQCGISSFHRPRIHLGGLLEIARRQLEEVEAKRKHFLGKAAGKLNKAGLLHSFISPTYDPLV